MWKSFGEICSDLGIGIHEEALRLIANRAEGGLRDAESLLDQIISFHEGSITLDSVTSILGVMSRDSFFAMDRAGKEGNLAMAFEMAHQVFTLGKDIVHFVESLTEHFRNILMVKMSGKNAPFLNLTQEERHQYEASAKLYSQEQCLNILDDLVEAQGQIRFMPCGRIALEAILLNILRSHQRIPIEYLVKRLTELEQAINANPTAPLPEEKIQPAPVSNISIDPTPTPADLGFKNQSPVKPAPAGVLEPAIKLSQEKQNRLDTLLQFAAVELEGTIQRKN